MFCRCSRGNCSSVAMIFSKVALVNHASIDAVSVSQEISSASMPDSLIKFLNCLFYDENNLPECMDKSNFSLNKNFLQRPVN